MKKNLSIIQLKKIELITKHFKSCFSTKNAAILDKIVPSENKTFLQLKI